MTKAYEQGYRETILLLNKKQAEGKADGGYITTLYAIAQSSTRTPGIEPDAYHHAVGQVKAIEAWREANK